MSFSPLSWWFFIVPLKFHCSPPTPGHTWQPVPCLKAWHLQAAAPRLRCSQRLFLGSWPKGSTIRVWREECEGWGQKGGSSPSLPARAWSPPWVPSSVIQHPRWVALLLWPPLWMGSRNNTPFLSFVSPGPRMIEASAVNGFQQLLHFVLILFTLPTVWVKGWVVTPVPHSYVEVLTPKTSECDCLRRVSSKR